MSTEIVVSKKGVAFSDGIGAGIVVDADLRLDGSGYQVTHFKFSSPSIGLGTKLFGVIPLVDVEVSTTIEGTLYPATGHAI